MGGTNTTQFTISDVEAFTIAETLATPVPEPGTVSLFLSALVGMRLWHLRKKRKAQAVAA